MEEHRINAGQEDSCDLDTETETRVRYRGERCEQEASANEQYRKSG